jgi:hypothetical protein
VVGALRYVTGAVIEIYTNQGLLLDDYR